MNRKVLILGAGGHSSILLDLLEEQNIHPYGVVTPEKIEADSHFSDLEHFQDDDQILDFSPQEIFLLNGIGSLPGNSLRSLIYNKFKQEGYEFLTLISHKALLSSKCHISEGVQILPGAIVNRGAMIGQNTIINSGSIIEHDCKVGKSNHIAPGAVLCGGTVTGENVHIGAGASVIQNIKIGGNSVVGSGSSVVRDIKENSTVLPASQRNKSNS